jgi:hypothetical protein
MMPVPVLAYLHFCPIPVLARYITGTAITWCPYRYWHFGTFVQYQYWHGPSLVLALNGASTSIGIFAVMSNTLARDITGTAITWCPYQYWQLDTLVHYQYWHGQLPVLAFNGASTGIGIFALWTNISIGMVHPTPAIVRGCLEESKGITA